MEKILSLLTGLLVGGLIVCALKIYMNHHLNPVHRFAPEMKPAEENNQEPEEESISEETDPGHFLSEQAIAQEYHRKLALGSAMSWPCWPTGVLDACHK
jgi:hypothetical protein